MMNKHRNALLLSYLIGRRNQATSSKKYASWFEAEQGLDSRVDSQTPQMG